MMNYSSAGNIYANGGAEGESGNKEKGDTHCDRVGRGARANAETTEEKC